MVPRSTFGFLNFLAQFGHSPSRSFQLKETSIPIILRLAGSNSSVPHATHTFAIVFSISASVTNASMMTDSTCP